MDRAQRYRDCEMQIAQSIRKTRMRFSHRRRVFSTRRSKAQFFGEVLHSEAFRRKRDSTHQDVVVFSRRFVSFGGEQR